MRPRSLVGLFVVCLVWLISASAGLAEEREPIAPRFVVYASEEDAELGASLFGVLRGNDKVSRIEKADTIERAVVSSADVLVLVLPKRELPKIESTTVEALKQRKIIGIGDELRVFEEAREVLKLPYPAGKIRRQDTVAFGPDGTLVIALQLSQANRDLHVALADIKARTFHTLFPWNQSEVKSVAVGRKAKWKE